MGTIYEQDDICIRKQLICARLLGLKSNEDVYYYEGYDRITNMCADVISEVVECPDDEKIIKHMVTKLIECRKQFAESNKKKIESFRK